MSLHYFLIRFKKKKELLITHAGLGGKLPEVESDTGITSLVQDE